MVSTRTTRNPAPNYGYGFDIDDEVEVSAGPSRLRQRPPQPRARSTEVWDGRRIELENVDKNKKYFQHKKACVPSSVTGYSSGTDSSGADEIPHRRPTAHAEESTATRNQKAKPTKEPAVKPNAVHRTACSSAAAAQKNSTTPKQVQYVIDLTKDEDVEEDEVETRRVTRSKPDHKWFKVTTISNSCAWVIFTGKDVTTIQRLVNLDVYDGKQDKMDWQTWVTKLSGNERWRNYDNNFGKYQITMREQERDRMPREEEGKRREGRAQRLKRKR